MQAACCMLRVSEVPLPTTTTTTPRGALTSTTLLIGPQLQHFSRQSVAALGVLKCNPPSAVGACWCHNTRKFRHSAHDVTELSAPSQVDLWNFSQLLHTQTRNLRSTSTPSLCLLFAGEYKQPHSSQHHVLEHWIIIQNDSHHAQIRNCSTCPTVNVLSF